MNHADPTGAPPEDAALRRVPDSETAAGAAAATTFTSAPFGATADGTPVERYVIANGGIRIAFLSYGGIVTEIVTPDRHGRPANIVLGYPTLDGYEAAAGAGGGYIGALIGRYANRIAGGVLRLDGRKHQLAVNEPPNTLHGGQRGFDRRHWAVRPHPVGDVVAATLTHVSPDGEEGFPGTLRLDVTYALTAAGTFRIGYRATTDRATVVNPTSHLYFNLAGAGSIDGVYRQVLTVAADHYLPTDASQIPLGEIAPVAGTPFDFRAPTPIGARLRDDHPQLALARGYDHTWVLDAHGPAAVPRWAARAWDPASGRTLDCLTTAPGVQVYTANGFGGRFGAGVRFRQTDGFTLETQLFPDSPNRPHFPSTTLRPGEIFESTTEFRFGVAAG